jgi:heme A synthase
LRQYATIVYYRRRVLGSARDALILGLLPLGAAGFLGWMLVRTLQNSVWTQRGSLIGIVALGLVMLLVARFLLRSPFFGIRRESDTQAS